MKTDLTTPEIDYIIGQHRVYGILPIEELNDITASSSVCYAIGNANQQIEYNRLCVRKESIKRIW